VGNWKYAYSGEQIGPGKLFNENVDTYQVKRVMMDSDRSFSYTLLDAINKCAD
jgi:hypothetical protein